MGRISWRELSRGWRRGMATMSREDMPVIVSAMRTPIGSFGGSLASLKAPKLGSEAIKGALSKIDLPPKYIEEVYMGNVCQAGVGQAPARQAAMGAGLPQETICTTVNKVCASGMKSISLASMGIMLGQCSAAVVGGFESMSNAPYLIEKARFGGYRYGDGKLVDSLIFDGLWDPYGDHHMGICAEKCAKDFSISREEMDEHVVESYKRAINAIEHRHFAEEIVPIRVLSRAGEEIVVEDEEPKKVKIEKIAQLKPAFKPAPEGKVTAANSSSINDGASALIVMSQAKAKELNLKPLARIVSFADAEQAPIDFTTTPSLALTKAFKIAGMDKHDVDLWEINQAFSVVSIANQRILNIDPSKIDISGGGVVLGHPIGCSGARIVTTLLHNLIRTDTTIGAASICNGGGGASAIVLERF